MNPSNSSIAAKFFLDFSHKIKNILSSRKQTQNGNRRQQARASTLWHTLGTQQNCCLTAYIAPTSFDRHLIGIILHTGCSRSCHTLPIACPLSGMYMHVPEGASDSPSIPAYSVDKIYSPSTANASS